MLTPPTTLIDGDTVVDLDGLEAHLLYVGPAHTPGDVVVHLPDEGIVFTGDILFHRCTPIGWEGTFANWIAALRAPRGAGAGDRRARPRPAGRHRRACGTCASTSIYVQDEARESFDAGR